MEQWKRFVCLEVALSVIPHNNPAYATLKTLPFIEECELKHHGQWRRTPVSGTLYCGVCDKIAELQIETPHCPECGAKLTPSEV